jgi:carbamoyl-phosphate synthase large subunit
VAGCTVADRELEQTARRVAEAIGLVGVANVQLRRDAEGRAALLEVNPRFPGAMPLTVAAGVDMPSLALDLALGRPLPDAVPFAEVAVVRYLEDVFLDPADVLAAPAADGDAR